jgi:imidazoleglycerol-phosphate dehydratase
MSRRANIHRRTKETDILAQLTIEGKGKYEVRTPIGFFNHMLESFAKHGLFDLKLTGEGDLDVDQHHLIEDCGIVLGECFKAALADKRGINRAGYFVYPMDEALAVVAVDLSGRPCLQFDAAFKRRFCGDMDTDLLPDFFQALSVHMAANLVIRMPFGRSDHHKMEAVFKALGKAMKMACSLDPRSIADIPSTKGEI